MLKNILSKDNSDVIIINIINKVNNNKIKHLVSKFQFSFQNAANSVNKPTYIKAEFLQFDLHFLSSSGCVSVL